MSRPFFSRSFHSREPLHRRNGKIRAREVRVIDNSREQLGVMSLGQALQLARAQGLDLVEIAPNATPPVCRLVDYGRFLYEEAKRTRDSRPSANKVKELQISASIDPHDLAVKREHAVRFLCDEIKVRVKLRFRGRQKAHKELGIDLMNRFVADLAAYGQADAPPKLLGDRDLSVLVTPLPRNRRGKIPRPPPGPESPAAPTVPPVPGPAV